MVLITGWLSRVEPADFRVESLSCRSMVVWDLFPWMGRAFLIKTADYFALSESSVLFLWTPSGVDSIPRKSQFIELSVFVWCSAGEIGGKCTNPWRKTLVWSLSLYRTTNPRIVVVYFWNTLQWKFLHQNQISTYVRKFSVFLQNEHNHASSPKESSFVCKFMF